MHDAKLLEKELGSRLRRLFVSRRFGAVRKNNRQIAAMRPGQKRRKSAIAEVYLPDARAQSAESAFRDFFAGSVQN